MTLSVLNQAEQARPIDVAVVREPETDPAGQPPARLWSAWLGLGAIYTLAQVFTDPTGPAGVLLTVALPMLFTAGIVLGVLVNRPRPRSPWLLLAAAGPISILGVGLWWAGLSAVAFPVFLTVYPLQAAALLLVVRGASWRQDRAGMLDTAMISVGLALACWLLVITPLMRMHTLLSDGSASLLPFGDVLLLSVLIRFFTSRGLRNAAFWQISASLLLQTGSHVLTLLPVMIGARTPDVRWLGALSAFLLAGAALHPSMRVLTGRPLRPVAEMSPPRVLLVNLACMGAPGLLIAQGVLQRGHVDWLAAGIGCIILFGLVALRMFDLVGQVQDKARQLDAVAHVDALTTLPNRRAWDLELSRRIAAARRHGSPIVVAIIDLDHFKKFNDTNGHQGGDALLSEAAAAWRTQLRPEDLLARYGGEEFGAIFDHSKLGDADRIIERLQAVTPLGQTFSAGAAQWNGSETAEELLARADAALYAAKEAGRDRVFVSTIR